MKNKKICSNRDDSYYGIAFSKYGSRKNGNADQ